jgi:hypothetical protein
MIKKIDQKNRSKKSQGGKTMGISCTLVLVTNRCEWRGVVFKASRGLVLGIIAVMAMTLPTHALTINPIFDQQWVSHAPPEATDVVKKVIGKYESVFQNNVQITIEFGWGDLKGEFLPPDFKGVASFPDFEPRYDLRTTERLLSDHSKLHGDNTVLATAVDHLPSSYPCGPCTSTLFFVPDAQLLALTDGGAAIDPNHAGINAYVSVGTNPGGPSAGWDYSGKKPDPNKFDFTSVIEHEIAHGMGRNDDAQNGPRFLTPLDFYKYDPDTKTLNPNFVATAFSIDGGKTLLQTFDDKSDSSDWRDAPGDSSNHSLPAGVAATVTPVDVWLLEALGWDGAASCNSECWNIFLSLPTTQATSLTAVLAGDVVANIDVAATQNNPLVNPFAYVNENFFGGAGTSSIRVSLDINGNTNVTYSGSHPILSTYQFEYGPQENGKPHFGFQGSAEGLSLNILQQQWSDIDTGSQPPLPAWSAPCPMVEGPIARYAVLYGEVSAAGKTAGEWRECAEGLGPTTWTITNPYGFDETLSNFGFFVSPFEIDLTLLNLYGVPPADQFGSPFIPLSQVDGLILPGNGSVSVIVDSEPTSLAILSAAIAGFGFAFARRRKGLKEPATYRLTGPPLFG